MLRNHIFFFIFQGRGLGSPDPLPPSRSAHEMCGFKTVLRVQNYVHCMVTYNVEYGTSIFSLLS